jgi:hypothetical protein
MYHPSNLQRKEYMSYLIIAGGTKAEAESTVNRACINNVLPEMPLIRMILISLINEVEGDDKRILINAQGYHSGGIVSHNIDFKTSQVFLTEENVLNMQPVEGSQAEEAQPEEEDQPTEESEQVESD